MPSVSPARAAALQELWSNDLLLAEQIDADKITPPKRRRSRLGCRRRCQGQGSRSRAQVRGVIAIAFLRQPRPHASGRAYEDSVCAMKGRALRCYDTLSMIVEDDPATRTRNCNAYSPPGGDMTVKAYSYLRFSAADQRLGDSYRRQQSLAEVYAAKNNLLMDDTLTYEDTGVSAFRSQNAKGGALREFLLAVESGFVERGSYLLVESLDRISRDQILVAQAIFLQIVSAGINLVTLIDGRCYSQKGINDNPFEMIFSLVTMMRAHEESATKSRRQRESWARKRVVATTRPMTGRCPGWLALNPATGRFEIDEHKAVIIQRIFADYLAGAGQLAIARALNRESVPTLGTQRAARCWRGDLIHRILRSSTVVGTMVPATRVEQEGVYRRVSLPPLIAYYPSVISQKVFDQTQREIQARLFASLNSDKAVWNVVGGLARCATCGCIMRMKITSSEGRRVRYLACERRVTLAGCPMVFARYDNVEGAILNRVHDLRVARDAYAGSGRSDKSHTKRVLDAVFRYEGDPRLQMKPLLSTYLSDFEVLASDPPYGSRKLNLALRRCVSAITVDPEGNRLIVRWHDGVIGSLLNVWPKPRVSNRHQPLPIRAKRQLQAPAPEMHAAYGLLDGQKDWRFPLLTLAQVKEAQDRRLAGETVSAIAASFGVSQSTIRRRLPRKGGRPPQIVRTEVR